MITRCIVLLFACVWMTACQKEANLKLPEQPPKLGVQAIWNKNNALEVTVTRSFSIRETPQFSYPDNPPSVLNKLKAYAVSNAQVLVFKDGSLYDELLFDSQKYMYKSATGKTATPDGSYSIKAVAPGFKEVTSSVMSFPETITIKSIAIKKSVGSDGIQGLDEVTIEFDDPVNTKNFYWITINRNFIPQPNAGHEYLYTDVFPIDNDILFPSDFEVSNDLPRVPSDRILLSDDNFDGNTKRVSIRIPSYLLVPSPPVRDVTISLNNASEDLFKYIRSRVLDSDNPFSTPVQSHTNITNGLGILGLYGGDTRVLQ
jgi:hypothetical protein